jgi:cytochrome c oxidase subunit 2
MGNTLQSALDPAGVQALRIEQLWWLMFWVSVVVWVLVIGFLVVAVRRAPSAAVSDRPVRITSDARLLRGVAIASGATILTLFVLLVASIVTGRALASQRDDTGLVVNVSAYQWWWDFEYQHPDPSQRVRVSNELRIPVGRTVAIKLTANDVIHSFWVPALHGKMDAIPGHEAYLWIKAETPGIYRGQCAEFCGYQHAHMALVVVAEPADAFERWLEAQRHLAVAPDGELARRGLDLVQQRPCAMCHRIAGTTAGGRTAPDLTHLASRSTIGAGTLPMSRENLTRWIANPQDFKPGVRMPAVGLSPEDLEAVVSYLERLK